ncbi:hypothetical protein [Bosea sp. BIWAKO-01]|uniref:hypothetical protein n=1 Tax=Bosea sp. BIWAKO-01 TaxID=506668 RepID=UPI00159F1808|nr:hypothetical protein [Bosea sp. BIWAKO-01]
MIDDAVGIGLGIGAKIVDQSVGRAEAQRTDAVAREGAGEPVDLTEDLLEVQISHIPAVIGRHEGDVEQRQQGSDDNQAAGQGRDERGLFHGGFAATM